MILTPRTIGFALAGGVVACVYLGWRIKRSTFGEQRRRALSSLANNLGGSFRETGAMDPGDSVRRLFTPLISFPLSAIRNVVRVGNVRVLDQISPRGPLLPPRWRTLALLQTGIDIGRVTLEPEGMVDRLGEGLGLPDIDFESEAFSRRFRVTGERRDLAYALFHEGMIEFLLRTRHDICISVAPGWTLFRKTSGRTSTSQVTSYIDIAKSFEALIPRHLRQDYPAS